MVLVSGFATLSACGPSKEERAARAADSIVAIADTAGRVFRGTVGGRPVALMVSDCKVFDLNDAYRQDGRRPSVLTTEFYPWPTFCMRQSIEADTAWVKVELGRTGFGAGGCCATGGVFRSRDGRTWEKRAAGKWIRVGSDSSTADSSSAVDGSRGQVS